MVCALTWAASCSGAGESARVPLEAGAAVADITPPSFETWRDLDGDAEFDGDKYRASPCGREPTVECFYDTGGDRLFDFEEAGAFGADAAPGRAGVDDDGNGTVDDCDRTDGCPEHRWPGSDDVADPAGDDYDAATQPDGSEGDGRFQWVVLAGFQGFISFEPNRLAQGVQAPLEARALALRQGETAVLLVELDLIGMFHVHMHPLKRRIEAELGVPFANQILASTHTHDGPDTMGIWTPGVDNAYLAFLADTVVATAREALDRLMAVTVTTTTTHTVACLERGSLRLEVDGDCRLGHSRRENLDDPTARFDEPILQNDLRDPWNRNLNVVAARFDRRDGGGPVATLVNWHDHPEMLEDRNALLSPDFPHYLRRRVEERGGGTAIYLSGTVGNQIGAIGTRVPLRDERGDPVLDASRRDSNGDPAPVLVGEPGIDKIRSVGFVVADAAMDALAAAHPVSAPPLTIATREVVNPIENSIFELLFLLGPLFTPFEPSERPFDAPGCGRFGCVRNYVSLLTLGELSLFSVPGELGPDQLLGRAAVTVSYPERGAQDLAFPAIRGLDESLPGAHHMVVSLAGNAFGYLIPASDYLAFDFGDWLFGTGNTTHPNFYEEEVSLGPSFGDTVSNAVLDLVGEPPRFGQR